MELQQLLPLVQPWLPIAATLLSPLIALRISTWLDRRKQSTERQQRIFRTLIATRTSRLSIAHVEALNMIEMEFYGRQKRNVQVVRAWRAYLDNLNTPPDSMGFDVWRAKNDEFFVELLQRMAVALGYDFDHTTLKNTAYSPIAHGNAEWDQLAIQKGFAAIMRGEKALPIAVSLPGALGKGSAVTAEPMANPVPASMPERIVEVSGTEGGSVPTTRERAK